MVVKIFMINAELLPASTPDVSQINTADELQSIVGKLAAHLMGQNIQISTDTYISTAQARLIAQKEGIDIPATTLKGAILQGTIPGARKPFGRWEMPEAAFRRWLEMYQVRKVKEY